MTDRPSEKLRRARFAVWLIFFGNGFVLASWVPQIPGVQERLGIGEGALGLALLAMAAGAIGAMPIAGMLIPRFGSRAITVATLIAYCFLLPFPVMADSYAALWGSLFLFGAFHGSMDVSMNAQAVAVEMAYPRPIMSSFHGLFSLGGLGGAAMAGLMLSTGVNMESYVWWVAGVTCAYSLGVALWMLPRSEESSADGPAFVLPGKALLGLGILAFLVLVAEGSMADWTAVYLRRVLSTSEALAATGYAAFSLAMASGRLLGDRVVSSVGPVTITRVSGLIAGVGLAIGLIVPHPATAIAGFACVGIGMSNLVPVIFSAAGRTKGVNAGTAIAAVSTAGYAGFLAGPPVIGFVAEFTSLRIGLGLVVAAVLLVAFFARLTK